MVIIKERQGRPQLPVNSVENASDCEESSSEVIVLRSPTSSILSQSDSRTKKKALRKGCTKVDNNNLDEFKNFEKKIKHINDVLSRKNFTLHNHLAKRHVSLQMFFVPLLSWISVTRAIVFLSIALLSEFNIQAKPEKNTTIAPSKHTLRQNLNHAASRVLVIISQKNKNIPIFLSMDRANKKGMCHMEKVLRFWEKDKNFLCAHKLDADSVLGSNKGVDEAVNHSLKKLDTNDSKVILHGTSADAGGGVVGCTC